MYRNENFMLSISLANFFYDFRENVWLMNPIV